MRRRKKERGRKEERRMNEDKTSRNGDCKLKAE